MLTLSPVSTAAAPRVTAPRVGAPAPPPARPAELARTGTGGTGKGGKASPAPSASPAAGPAVATTPGRGGVVVQATGAMAQGLEVEQVGSDGLATAQCSAPGTDFWFVGPGVAGASHVELYLMNTDGQPADAEVDALTDSGPLLGSSDTGIIVPPHSMVVQSLGTYLHGSHALSLHVTTSTGRMAAAVRQASNVTTTDAFGVSTSAEARGRLAARHAAAVDPADDSGPARHDRHRDPLPGRAGRGQRPGQGHRGDGQGDLPAHRRQRHRPAGRLRRGHPDRVAVRRPRRHPDHLQRAGHGLGGDLRGRGRRAGGGQRGRRPGHRAGRRRRQSAPVRRARPSWSSPRRARPSPSASPTATAKVSLAGQAGTTVTVPAGHTVVTSVTPPKGGGPGPFSVVVTPQPGSGPVYIGRVIRSGGIIRSILPLTSALTWVPLPPAQDSLNAIGSH